MARNKLDLTSEIFWGIIITARDIIGFFFGLFISKYLQFSINQTLNRPISLFSLR
ncbi:hypothetical protein C0J52_11524 [Blattella germanica]|nr:hypothetical protein C0J52_11524 [Blattella germanica]